MRPSKIVCIGWNYKSHVSELKSKYPEVPTIFFIWQAVYKGYYKAWHEVPIATIKNPKGKTRTMSTMNAGKMACSQMARYVWNERCSISVSMEGREDAEEDPLDEYLQEVLCKNRRLSDFHFE